MTRFAYVGCRTSAERRARGRGIGVWRVTAPDAPWEEVQVVEGLSNPAWLTLSADGQRLYALEGDGEWLHAFAVRPDGGLAPGPSRRLHGRNPVHAAPSPCGRWLLVANHLSSAIAVLPLDAAGWPGEVAHLLELQGEPGPHRVEQPFAKPHQIVFDPSGGVVLVPDKGLDVVHVLALEEGTGRLVHRPAPRLRAGCGPRHAAFHPTWPLVYVLGELNSTITVLRLDSRSPASPWQVVGLLPEDFCGESRAAAIAVSADGRMLYATNRGHDSVVVMGLDPQTGWIHSRRWVPAGGRTPRFMALAPAGGVLNVASEDDDRILAFRRQGEDLRPLGTVAESGSPTCIAQGPRLPQA